MFQSRFQNSLIIKLPTLEKLQAFAEIAPISFVVGNVKTYYILVHTGLDTQKMVRYGGLLNFFRLNDGRRLTHPTYNIILKNGALRRIIKSFSGSMMIAV